jgi:hypothetical protein
MLSPHTWKQAHPEAIRKYRQEVRLKLADGDRKPTGRAHCHRGGASIRTANWYSRMVPTQ